MKCIDTYITEKLHLKKGVKRDIEHDELFAIWVDDKGEVRWAMTYRMHTFEEFEKYLTDEYNKQGIHSLKIFTNKDEAIDYRDELKAAFKQ